MPYVTASVALVAVWLFLFGSRRPGQQVLGPLAPDPSWLVNSHLAMPMIAIFVTWKQLGFFILLYLAALQNVPEELYESASWTAPARSAVLLPSPCPASGRPRPWSSILATITGANLFTEPYLLTGGGGPDGASASPVLLMYQKGIEQGHPDVAAAIGVMLVIVVLAHRWSPAGCSRGTDMTTTPGPARRRRDRRRPRAPRRGSSGSLLLAGAVAFLFPFYYMVVGSLQKTPDTDLVRGLSPIRAT